MASNKKRQINTSPLDSITAEMLGSGDGSEFFQDDSLRVERILLDMVRPDPIQPRRVLPDRIYQAFHAGQMTPTQALRELIQIAQLAARQHGRPFTSVLDLLGNPDDESEDLPPLTAEEQLVHDLVNLAITIRDDGQVNPLTVVDVSEGVMRQYRIETGERRYWATWLLRDFIPGYESDGMIPCIVIPAESSSAFRQAKENTARSGLSAIAMARQAALLLLYVHGYPMPDGPVPADFYRQALDLTLRGKREYTAVILSAMGGINRKQFSRFKSLLRLCDEAMELADRHDIDEARLRYVIQLEARDQVELLRQIVQLGLTRKQVKDLIENNLEVTDDVTDDPIPRQIIQLAKVMASKNLPDPQSLASYLASQEQNMHLARARLQTLRQLLDQAEQYLSE